jgi:hypothetical protein
MDVPLFLYPPYIKPSLLISNLVKPAPQPAVSPFWLSWQIRTAFAQHKLRRYTSGECMFGDNHVCFRKAQNSFRQSRPGSHSAQGTYLTQFVARYERFKMTSGRYPPYSASSPGDITLRTLRSLGIVYWVNPASPGSRATIIKVTEIWYTTLTLLRLSIRSNVGFQPYQQVYRHFNAQPQVKDDYNFWES